MCYKSFHQVSFAEGFRCGSLSIFPDIAAMPFILRTLIVSSCEPEAICRPSGEKATDVTTSLWPSSVTKHSPLSVSQILKVVSYKPEAICRLTGEKAIDVTQLLWPSSVTKHSLLSVSQTLTVLLCKPEAICWLSGEKATDETASLWPSMQARAA